MAGRTGFIATQHGGVQDAGKVLQSAVKSGGLEALKTKLAPFNMALSEKGQHAQKFEILKTLALKIATNHNKQYGSTDVMMLFTKLCKSPEYKAVLDDPDFARERLLLDTSSGKIDFGTIAGIAGLSDTAQAARIIPQAPPRLFSPPSQGVYETPNQPTKNQPIILENKILYCDSDNKIQTVPIGSMDYTSRDTPSGLSVTTDGHGGLEVTNNGVTRSFVINQMKETDYASLAALLRGDPPPRPPKSPGAT